MAEQLVIYRNLQGEPTRMELRKWREEAQKNGLHVEEKGKGNFLEISFSAQEDRCTMYFYEQSMNYQLQVDYLRIRKANHRLVWAVDRMLSLFRLKGERFSNQNGLLVRTFYLNGLVMDEGPVVERKVQPDFELRVFREAMMGHIYLALDDYTQARSSGDAVAESEAIEKLRSYSEELSHIDEALQSGHTS